MLQVPDKARVLTVNYNQNERGKGPLQGVHQWVIAQQDSQTSQTYHLASEGRVMVHLLPKPLQKTHLSTDGGVISPLSSSPPSRDSSGTDNWLILSLIRATSLSNAAARALESSRSKASKAWRSRTVATGTCQQGSYKRNQFHNYALIT